MHDLLQSCLNEAQLRLLTLSGKAPDVPEAVWQNIQASVSQELIDRLGEEAAALTDERGWDDADFHRLARSRMRHPVE